MPRVTPPVPLAWNTPSPMGRTHRPTRRCRMVRVSFRSSFPCSGRKNAVYMRTLALSAFVVVVVGALAASDVRAEDKKSGTEEGPMVGHETIEVVSCDLGFSANKYGECECVSTACMDGSGPDGPPGGSGGDGGGGGSGGGGSGGGGGGGGDGDGDGDDDDEDCDGCKGRTQKKEQDCKDEQEGNLDRCLSDGVAWSKILCERGLAPYPGPLKESSFCPELPWGGGPTGICYDLTMRNCVGAWMYGHDGESRTGKFEHEVNWGPVGSSKAGESVTLSYDPALGFSFDCAQRGWKETKACNGKYDSECEDKCESE